MSEPTCTESAPCFACARCVRTMANVLRDDPNVRAHMTGVETRPAWRPAWKRAAEAGGSLRGDGAEGTITIKAEAGTVHIDRPHIATLPTGERVDLPAGTVLREGTLPPEAEDDRPTLGEQLHDEHNHKLAAEEEIARKAAQIGPASYDRARGRISFKPVEVVEAPGVTQTEIDARTAAEMMRPLYEGAGLPHVAADAVPPAKVRT